MAFLAASLITMYFASVLDIVTVYSFLATYAIADVLKIKNGRDIWCVVCIRIRALLIPYICREIEVWGGLIYGLFQVLFFRL